MIWHGFNLIGYLLLNALDLFFIIRFFMKIFGKWSLESGRGFLLAAFGLLFFSCFIKPEIPYTNLVNLSCFSLIFLFFHKGPVKSRGLIALLLVSVAGVSQSVPWFLLNHFQTGPQPGVILIGHLLFLCLLELAGRLCRMHEHSPEGRLWVLLLLIPVTSFFSIPGVLLLSLNAAMPAAALYGCVLPLLAFLIFINIAAFYLFDRLSVFMQDTEQKIRLEEQLQYQTAYYKSMEESQSEVRRIRHDMKNHLETIQSLLVQEREEDALNYIGTLSKSVTQIERVISTQNPPIDTILNIKRAAAIQRGIRFGCQINIPAGLPVSYEQAAAILGNLLDNAMEAQQQIGAERREINVSMSYNKEALLLSIRNPCRSITGAGLPEGTTKADKKRHGLGLLNVKKAVDSLDGTLKLTCEGGSFQADVLLFLPVKTPLSQITRTARQPFSSGRKH